MMSTRTLVIIIVAVLTAFLLYDSVYTVDERERAVLLEFGKVIEDDIKPGLQWKKPYINEVRKFDGRVLTLDAPAERFLTLEKKAVIVDSFAKFRIDSPRAYYTGTSGDEFRARELLKQRINGGLRNAISRRTMHEVVSGERDQLMTELRKDLDTVARKELGVEIVDIRVKRIDLPPEVSQSVYDRMNTEREIEAKQHRAGGQELAAGIKADAERQTVVIGAEAYRQAEETRGEGDAIAAATYAQAYNQDPEFYSFYRSMGAYRTTFSNKRDFLLVDPKSDFFRYLNKGSLLARDKK